MTGPRGQEGKEGQRRRGAWLPAVYAAIGIWLAWQILLGPVIQRAPPELAAQLAPTSPLVLSRGAESEFAAGRIENADFLARARLRQSPFDVRALRVAGLVAARNGQDELANEVVTLAGNWSLRDDPAHAWLIEYRLRRGDYGSAFAHADTLVRRREDVRTQVFDLFTTAANSDPRSLPVLIDLLSVRPPWSESYFNDLYQSPEGLQLATNLALGLQRTEGPISDAELRRLYYFLLQYAAPEGIAALRARLNRPPQPRTIVHDGDFETARGIQPFGWRLSDQAGLVAEIATAPTGGNALYVVYQGFGDNALVDQLVAAAPGRYRLQGRLLTTNSASPSALSWVMTCAGGGAARLSMSPAEYETESSSDWTRFSADVEIPATGCPVQWLKLDAPSRDRSRAVDMWFDELALLPR